MNRPNFIIIGAMKSATSTLHDQLDRQPGIFMSREKEPNFFSDDAVYARGLDWYASLFQSAPRASLRGESSTHYTKLPTYGKAAWRIRRTLPDAKLIYVMRHPMDRLISHYIHGWTQNDISTSLSRAVDLHPELVHYGRYAMQLEPYLELFDPQQILPVFFERLVTHPQSELERVCQFLGYEGTPTWQDLPPSNVSKARMRHSPARNLLLGVPGVRPLAASLPDPIRERLKDHWRVNRRPQLDPVREERLRRVFDHDLMRLGCWLGIDLDSSNYKSLVTSRSLDWSERYLEASA